jgi:pimeloyl-ACP methyl ester carboxylesterase
MAMQHIDSRPGLAATRCPTLVVVGEDDVLTPPDRAAEIVVAIPGARRLVVRAALPAVVGMAREQARIAEHEHEQSAGHEAADVRPERDATLGTGCSRFVPITAMRSASTPGSTRSVFTRLRASKPVAPTS